MHTFRRERQAAQEHREEQPQIEPDPFQSFYQQMVELGTQIEQANSSSPLGKASRIPTFWRKYITPKLTEVTQHGEE